MAVALSAVVDAEKWEMGGNINGSCWRGLFTWLRPLPSVEGADRRSLIARLHFV
jgi:hypothetical protein